MGALTCLFAKHPPAACVRQGREPNTPNVGDTIHPRGTEP